ncbi:hypothetical protein F1D61_00755 [Methylobacterium aquaticum]|nr:hypothetical protein F1D61_00755 [Methylobacterium aquaticum]
MLAPQDEVAGGTRRSRGRVVLSHPACLERLPSFPSCGAIESNSISSGSTRESAAARRRRRRARAGARSAHRARDRSDRNGRSDRTGPPGTGRPASALPHHGGRDRPGRGGAA